MKSPEETPMYLASGLFYFSASFISDSYFIEKNRWILRARVITRLQISAG
jgi:hypothetical protein